MRDYYVLLGIARDADADDVKKAYRKAAIKWHPDKWSSKPEAEQKAAEEQFKEIAEAYDVLSDTEKRAVFDRYGEAGLKAGGPPPPTPDSGGEAHARPGPGSGYTFRGDPNEVFAQFFAQGLNRQSSFGETPFDGGGGLEEMFGMCGGRPGGCGGHAKRRAHVPARECDITCTLEELFRGKVKKLKVTRKTLTPGREAQKVLEVPIRAGFKAGTRITFSGEGDELKPGVSEDLIFVIREAKHDRFVREGSDLHFRARLSLADALCSPTIDVKTLDEEPKIKRVHMRAPVSNLTTKVLAGEGMPKSKEPGKRGDLILSFTVVFPQEPLTPEQAAKLRAALPA